MGKKGSDRVSRQSGSFLGTGIGEVHKTPVHEGRSTYPEKGTSRRAADKATGDKDRARAASAVGDIALVDLNPI